MVLAYSVRWLLRVHSLVQEGTVLSLCILNGGRGKGSPWSLFYERTNPIHEGSTLMTGVSREGGNRTLLESPTSGSLSLASAGVSPGIPETLHHHYLKSSSEARFTICFF